MLVVASRIPPGRTGEIVLGLYGSLAAFMFVVWAWAARQVLDTEPDVQRQLSAIALGSRARAVIGGLLAAYALNVVFAAILAGAVLAQTIALPLEPAVHPLGVGLLLLTALPATALGAWTSRAMIPSPGASVLTLLGACLGVVLLSRTALLWVSAPIIPLVRAASAGPDALTAQLPRLAIHTAVWSGVVAGAYAWMRRYRP